MEINLSRLASVSEIIDCPHSTPIWRDSGIPVIRNFNLVDGMISKVNLSYVDYDDFKARTKRVVPQENDLLFSREAPIGNVALVPPNFQCCQGQRIVLIRPNRAQVLPEYLLAAFQSDYAKRQFSIASKTGSIVSNFGIGDLANMLIPIPNMETQEKIARFYSQISRKIQINNEINDNLQQLIALLYNGWFGSPNIMQPHAVMVFNPKLKRQIPSNWLVASFANNPLCSFIDVGVDRFEKKNYLATANVINDQITDGEWIDYDTRESRANMQPILDSVWFAKMKSSVKHIFVPRNAVWMTDKYIFSTGFTGLKCTHDSFSYIASTIMQPYFELTKDTLSHGATQQSVNNDDLDSIPLLIPDVVSLRKYSIAVSPLFEKIADIKRENQHLEKMRNELLPLLFNGQVTLS